jgi:SAM-dependent methyltransferase
VPPAPTAATSVASSASAPAPLTREDAGDPLELEAQKEWTKEEHVDIVYVPTPQKVVDKMMEAANVTSKDVVYDLGCGDGRLAVAAAKRGAKAIGFDIDPKRVEDARAHVKAAGVEALASIKWANVFSVDLSSASVVTLYLLPELNVRLIPQLEKLSPGSRIVSHDFNMEGVVPFAEWDITAPEFVNKEGYSAYQGEGVPEDSKSYKQRNHHIYVWKVPLEKVAPKKR